VTLRSALLSFRIQRFESTIIIGATILSVVVSAVVIWLFTRGGYAQCLAFDTPVFNDVCQSDAAAWTTKIARVSSQLVPLFPVVVGLLAGGPIVARELETGTARLAWSLGPSRLRWLAQRALPILAMVFAAGIAIGLTSGALIHLLVPSVDLDNAFTGFRLRGVLVGVEALGIASIALAVGAILGRLVPTLILTLILVGALTTAIDKVDRTLLTSEALQGEGPSYQFNEADLWIDSRLKFPNGEVLTYEEAYRTHPELQFWEGEVPPYTDVTLYIPGERYQAVERREALALGGLTLAFIAVAAVAVARRRPR
jgi:hypothetical protein